MPEWRERLKAKIRNGFDWLSLAIMIGGVELNNNSASAGIGLCSEMYSGCDGQRLLCSNNPLLVLGLSIMKRYRRLVHYLPCRPPLFAISILNSLAKRC